MFLRGLTKQGRNKLFIYVQNKVKVNFIWVRNNKGNQFFFYKINILDFFLSNGYIVLWVIFYMYFLILFRKLVFIY